MPSEIFDDRMEMTVLICFLDCLNWGGLLVIVVVIHHWSNHLKEIKLHSISWLKRRDKLYIDTTLLVGFPRLKPKLNVRLLKPCQDA